VNGSQLETELGRAFSSYPIVIIYLGSELPEESVRGEVWRTPRRTLDISQCNYLLSVEMYDMLCNDCKTLSYMTKH
jgi:hypothetical protein